jgi:hypothetical protein
MDVKRIIGLVADMYEPKSEEDNRGDWFLEDTQEHRAIYQEALRICEEEEKEPEVKEDTPGEKSIVFPSGLLAMYLFEKLRQIVADDSIVILNARQRETLKDTTSVLNELLS